MRNHLLENELKPALSPDEKLIWTGKPKAGIIFRGIDVFLIPFTLLWFGFAVFWEATVLATDSPFFFKLFGIPFVLFGFYICIGRFYFEAKNRSNTVYGITADRIVTKSGLFNLSFKSINIKTLSNISFTQKTDGSGTISLGPSDFRSSLTQGMAWPGIKNAPQLEAIENVKQVYDILMALQSQK